jgi:hypothetical protein
MKDNENMKKYLFAGCCMLVSMQLASKQLTHEECKNKVDQALSAAFIEQRFNADDGTFPRRETTITVAVDVPKSFTTKHAQSCGRGMFKAFDALEDKVSVEIIHGDKQGLGSIRVRVIRAHYEQAKKAYEDAVYGGKSAVEKVFEFYQLDQQY